MRSHDLPQEPYAFACGVTLIPKTKRCGKNNCGDCPHGPYWYARAPHTATYGTRLDLYLGSYWTTQTLLDKVVPQLNPGFRSLLGGEIMDIQNREKLASLKDDLAHARAEGVSLRANFQQHLRDNQRDILRLNAECNALVAKLNPTKTPPKPKLLREAARRPSKKAAAHA